MKSWGSCCWLEQKWWSHGRDVEKKRRKGEVVSISHPANVANISPHRMYEMYLLGNICFFLTSFWQTPLHFAARYGYIECVEKLLQYGADKSLKNVWNHQEYWEGDWEIWYETVSHWQCVSKRMSSKKEWQRERLIFKFWGAFFLHVFLILCGSPT